MCVCVCVGGGVGGLGGVRSGGGGNLRNRRCLCLGESVLMHCDTL